MKLSGSERRLKIPTGFPAAIGGGQSVWLGDLGAVLSWDLDLWGEHADAAAQTRALAQAAKLDIDNARLLLAGALVQSYIDLDRSYALADIAERAEAQRANILEITRRRVAAGLDTRVELREAEGTLPQARLALMQAQSAQALAVHQLAALGGHGADAYAGISRPQLNLEAALPLPNELPVNLLARRPDVIAARARIEAADAQKRAARAAFYPNISLTRAGRLRLIQPDRPDQCPIVWLRRRPGSVAAAVRWRSPARAIPRQRGGARSGGGELR